MKLQQLLSYTRRAIDDYNMIQEGDKIIVALSGGKVINCHIIYIPFMDSK